MLAVRQCSFTRSNSFGSSLAQSSLHVGAIELNVMVVWCLPQYCTVNVVSLMYCLKLSAADTGLSCVKTLLATALKGKHVIVMSSLIVICKTLLGHALKDLTPNSSAIKGDLAH